ncbi:amidase [Haladaptatus salinisoli]|uniref:amidase n=1 Tax=Haladaptatus salinisoli TaxID=2884876 RepID=UPI001D0B3445|nr:amidase [Haladaptatus salinisoli]
MFVGNAQLTEAIHALRSGCETPTTYVEDCRDRVEAIEDDICALVPEANRWERLQRQTREREANSRSDPTSRPPLYGIPVGIKDIFRVDGMPTRAGSDLPLSALAGRESVAWHRLREAGAIPFGKTVTTEFAYFDPGPTRNPHDANRTPGGSSSGSAALVAAGGCPLALGTQTIGSVIRPAAFCGIVGFKPTFGRIPIDGVIPLSPSLDHVGFFTQTIADAALPAAILCDNWRTLPDPVERPTLGVPADAYLNQAGETGQSHFERHLNDLSDSGYSVIKTDLFADIGGINSRHNRLMAAEAALVHQENEWYPAYQDRYAEKTRDLIEEGREVSIKEVAAGRADRANLRTELRTKMAETDIDVWISPAAPGPAPKGIDSTGDPIMNLPWTNAGVPTVTLPVDQTDAGLPLGLQCAAAPNADEELLGWATTLADDLGTITE